jgi:hypothetical protein
MIEGMGTPDVDVAAAATSPTVGVGGSPTALTGEGIPVTMGGSSGSGPWSSIVNTGTKIGVGMMGAQNALATYMPGISTDYSQIQPTGSAYDYSTVQDVDYSDIADTLSRIAPSVDSSGLPQIDSHSALDNPAWQSEVDYLDYLDEITDDLTV